jgi:hypothetical protein
MLTRVCLLLQLDARKFPSLRKSLSNRVDSEGNNALNNVAIEEDLINNVHSNAVKTLPHCMMLNGLASLIMMLQKASLLDLPKRLLFHAGLVLNLQKPPFRVQEFTSEVEKVLQREPFLVELNSIE